MQAFLIGVSVIALWVCGSAFAKSVTQDEGFDFRSLDPMPIHERSFVISRLDGQVRYEAYLYWANHLCEAHDLECRFGPLSGAALTSGLSEREQYALWDHEVSRFPRSQPLDCPVGFSVVESDILISLTRAAIRSAQIDRARTLVECLQSYTLSDQHDELHRLRGVLSLQYELAVLEADYPEALELTLRREENFWQRGELGSEQPHLFERRLAPRRRLGALDNDHVDQSLTTISRHAPSYAPANELLSYRFTRLSLRAETGDCEVPGEEINDLIALLSANMKRQFVWPQFREDIRQAQLCFAHALRGASPDTDSCQVALQSEWLPQAGGGPQAVFGEGAGYLELCPQVRTTPEVAALLALIPNPETRSH
ncbi:hypothetical protein [Oceanicaulis alexandrii]|uniref:hypothetical protein n=1 Tax=Oceanicaulis alexandrii TaxID=153233 RepID=UPI002357FA6D|nr:hypothetical protein [Oceanicaulis alexandrii]